MKPVMQTKFGEEGNCFSACVASMLELETDEVPIFYQTSPASWWIDFTNWLKDYGYFPIHDSRHHVYPIFHIASGTAKRGFEHAVIYKGDKLAHDPYPGGKGFVDSEVRNRTYFLPIEIKQDTT